MKPHHDPPLPPAILMGALQDSVHRDPGVVRARTRREGDVKWTQEDLDGLKRLRADAEKALAQIKIVTGKRPDWWVNWPVVRVVSAEWALQEDGSGIHRVWVGKSEDRKLEEEMERLLKAEGWTNIEVKTEW